VSAADTPNQPADDVGEWIDSPGVAGTDQTTPDFSWVLPLLAYPPLPGDQVSERMQEIEVGLFASERLIERGSLLSALERRELKQLRAEGREAFDLLVRSNLRLVFHWTKGISRSLGPDWCQDAFQAGVMGLIRGLQTFDHSKGFALSTYVTWHIRQSVQRWRANETNMVRLPVHLWEQIPIWHRDGLPVPALVQNALDVLSTDALHKSDFDQAVGDEQVKSFEAEFDIEIALAVLDERSRRIVVARFGLDGDEPETLDSIAVGVGVTRERIRQIEVKALKTLRSSEGLRHLGG
jgi:RNA polymerase sigma factor (sigma-70 family)